VLYFKPSTLSTKKREKYVLDAAKKLVENWNFLPPQKSDKERIQFFVNERNKYLGTELKFIWTTSPSSLEITLALSLGSNLGASLRSTLESFITSSLKPAYESERSLSPRSELGSAIWSALGSSLRSELESSLRSSLELSLKSSLDASLISSLGSELKSSLKSSLETMLGSSLEAQFESSLGISLWSSLGPYHEAELKSSLETYLRASFGSELESSLKSSLETSLVSELSSEIGSSIETSLKAALETSLKASLESGLRSSLGSSIETSFTSLLRSSLESALRSSVRSFHDFIFWDIFYRFNEDKTVKNFVSYLPEAYKEGGLGFAIIGEREFYALGLPKYFLNDQHRLHMDYSPAVIWEDGTKEYYLNGVRMPENIVLAKPEEIDPELLFREQNAAVRREIIRKAGYSRILQKLNAKKLDSYQEYDLYRIENIDVEPINILKVKCPSTGVYYSLRVPPDILKARDAINWVNQGIDKEEFMWET
jgi:hypothetical protein